jgi:hypothetical protein
VGREQNVGQAARGGNIGACSETSLQARSSVGRPSACSTSSPRRVFARSGFIIWRYVPSGIAQRMVGMACPPALEAFRTVLFAGRRPLPCARPRAQGTPVPALNGKGRSGYPPLRGRRCGHEMGSEHLPDGAGMGGGPDHRALPGDGLRGGRVSSGLRATARVGGGRPGRARGRNR